MEQNISGVESKRQRIKQKLQTKKLNVENVRERERKTCQYTKTAHTHRQTKTKRMNEINKKRKIRQEKYRRKLDCYSDSHFNVVEAHVGTIYIHTTLCHSDYRVVFTHTQTHEFFSSLWLILYTVCILWPDTWMKFLYFHCLAVRFAFVCWLIRLI